MRKPPRQTRSKRPGVVGEPWAMWYAEKRVAEELEAMAKVLDRLAKKRRRMNEKFGNGWSDVAWGIEEAVAILERRAKKIHTTSSKMFEI